MPEKRKGISQKSRIQKVTLLLVIITVLLAMIILLLPPRDAEPGKAGRPAAIQATDPPAHLSKTAPPAGKDSGPTKPWNGESPPPVMEDQVRTEPGTGRSPWASSPGPIIASSTIAIVIDDAGNSLHNLMAFLNIPARLTIAVLPGLVYSGQSAEMITAGDKEVILHLPMEAFNGDPTGPGGIYTADSEVQIRAVLAEDFTSIPGARGANNHMGSKATADGRVMDILMQFFREKGKYFLDSRTYAGSLAGDYAGRYAVPFLQRDIFLDNDADKESISKQMEAGMQLAKQKGRAVLIGHVQNSQLVEVILDYLPVMQKEGIEIVYLSELLYP
jgi:hypothetical protein